MINLDEEIVSVLAEARLKGYDTFIRASKMLAEAVAIIALVRSGEQKQTDYLEKVFMKEISDTRNTINGEKK